MTATTQQLSIHRCSIACVLLLISSLQLQRIQGFSLEGQPDSSRRDYVKYSIGAAAAVAYGKIVRDATERLSRGIVYPIDHERRVQSTIATTLSEANHADMLRVLEVGIGPECRTIRRGLYNKAIKELSESKAVSRMELRGIDLKAPSKQVLRESREVLLDAAASSLTVDFDASPADITTQISSYPNGYFDSIICSLTLCSVSDSLLALSEIKRLLRPDGGTFGYVEHVAVEAKDDAPFLEWQQEFFDPVQQILADNCHLHRHTEKAIADVFGLEQSKSRLLQNERFFVDNMWPVSCQCCGVIQTTS